MVHDMIYDTYDIFVNCSCVATRWQQYSTHLHTNSTQNNTINNKIIANFGRVRAVPRLCELYPGICLTAEEKARKTSVRAPEEFHSFLTSALDIGERLTARFGRFTCAKEPPAPIE